MKAVFFVIVAVALMCFAGWIRFSNDGESASATINTQEVKKDTADAVQKGQQLIEDGKQMLNKATNETEADPAKAIQ